MPTADALRAAVRDVPDFPKPGIIFKDITPILADPMLFNQAVGLMAETLQDQKINKIVGIEARGFIFGAALSHHLGVGFIPLRKKGKLPWKTHEQAYQLEYGEAVIELHQDAVIEGENVILVDDLLATGGTLAAAIKLLDRLQAKLVGIAVLVELEFLQGRDKLNSHPLHSILKY